MTLTKGPLHRAYEKGKSAGGLAGSLLRRAALIVRVRDTENDRRTCHMDRRTRTAPKGSLYTRLGSILKVGRLKQRHGQQSTTLASIFYINLCWKVIYVYSYESNFQDKSICMIFTFSNSMIYIPNV
jgi:hypothetical protein